MLEDVACVAGPYSSQTHTKSVCCAWVAPMLRRRWKDLIAAPVRTCRLRSSAPPAAFHPYPSCRRWAAGRETASRYPGDVMSCHRLSARNLLTPEPSVSFWGQLPPSPWSAGPDSFGYGEDDAMSTSASYSCAGWRPPQRSQVSPSLHSIGSC